MRIKQSSQICINLCLSLVGFYVVFLAGAAATPETTQCRNISTAVHYFALVTVGWMTVESVNMYLLFVKLGHVKVDHFVPVSCAAVYGKKQ